MNSVWLTSPFVQFDTENLIYNETLCSEAHFLNKFSRDKYKTEQRKNDRQGNINVLSDYSCKSDLLAKKPERIEEIEENFTITVNARRETANGVLEIDSRISSKRTESGSTLSESNVRSWEDPWPRGCKATESRDPLRSCPFELVQIYPGNKEDVTDLARVFSDVSREGSSMICFPKEDRELSRSAAFAKDAPSKVKLSHGDSESDESPLATIRSQKNLKQASALNALKAPRFNESKPADLEKKNGSFETNAGKDVSSSSSSDEFEKSRSTKGKTRLKEGSRRALKKTEKLTNCLEHETISAARIESEKSPADSAPNEDQSVEAITSLEATSICNANEFDDYSVDKAKKSTHDLSGIVDISVADWFTGDDDTAIDACEGKSNPEIRGAEENLKAVADGRDQGTKKMETIRAIDTRNPGGNRTAEIVEYADDDASNGTIRKEAAKLDVDYGDIKICNLLLVIHKQLYSNFRKMENIWIQLQDTSSLDSVRSTVPMRLLVRIISRCKSYIHDSQDSYSAESKIAETLLGLVIDLAKAVDQNKLVVEKQEQQIDGILLKLYQEKNLYRKRIMINEIVSFWDHGLREICDIMQDILDRMKIVVVEAEEKENVRNPRRKDVYVEWRGPKSNLASRGSNIELRMPAVANKHNSIRQSKSKTSMKSLIVPRSREAEKIGDVVAIKITERKNNENVSLQRYNATGHPKSKPSTKSLNIQRIRDAEKLSDSVAYKIVERKTIDNARCNERGKLLKKPTQSVNFEQWRPMYRQKSRVANNQQPVWRPGGVAKLPSSSSATALTQRSRPLLPQAGDKASQPTEYMKKEFVTGSNWGHPKYGRPGELRKKIGTETYSAKCRAHNSANDSSKQLNRKCTTYQESAAKYKLKSRPLKVCFEQDSESSCRSESSSPERIARWKNSKETKVLKLLEEIIKSTPDDKKDKKHGNKSSIGNHRIETSSIDPVKPVSIEEEVETSQDEPTRDIEPNQTLSSRSKCDEIFDETPQSIQKISERLLSSTATNAASSSITIIKDQTIESRLDIHLENSQAKNTFSFACATTTNCTVDLKSSSDYTSEIGSSENYQSSANFEPLPPDRKQREDELKARKDLVIVEAEESKNLTEVNKEILKNLSSINEERSENSTDINEGMLNNPSTINEEKSKNPSSINEEKSRNPSSINNEKSKEPSSINEERSKNPSLINEEKSKNPSSISEEKSKTSSSINKENSREPSSINEERSKNPSSINEEKSKHSSLVNETITNSHTMSLTMLKEFLRDQGVDVNLLNKAEQCMRDKRKCRSCSKAKSASLADVDSSDQQHDDRREPSAQSGREIEILEKIMKICERRLVASENGGKNENCKGNGKLPERKDASTSTDTKNEDAGSQTIPQKTVTKCVQIIVEEDTALTKRNHEKGTIETQTEIVSIRHTDCCTETIENTTKVESSDAWSMTESTAVRDGVAETLRVCYVSKMTTTERSNSTENIRDRSRRSTINLIEISSKTNIKDDQRFPEEHNRERSNKAEESSDESPSNREQDGGGRRPFFRESDSSASSCSLQRFPICSRNCNCNATADPEFDYFGKMIPWETIASLQSATIRARNMYNAIRVYQHRVETKCKEEAERKLAEKEKNNSEKHEQTLKSLSGIDSMNDIIVEDSYHCCKHVDILSRAEMASSDDESDQEITRPVSTSITNVSRNQKNGSDDVRSLKSKSSSGAVSRDAGSLTELLLIQKMDDAKDIDIVETVLSRTCSKIRIEVSRTEIAPFSRQRVLMLVYGVVCSIVFWCLQFTITCDVVA